MLFLRIRPTTSGTHNIRGISKVILGKEFNNLCGSFLGIYDPDADTINSMKKLVDGLISDFDK